ncbi:hypothetical protein LINPERPRIM_LOCUS5912, partial [Linum perenne]
MSFSLRCFILIHLQLHRLFHYFTINHPFFHLQPLKNIFLLIRLQITPTIFQVSNNSCKGFRHFELWFYGSFWKSVVSFILYHTSSVFEH